MRYQTAVLPRSEDSQPEKNKATQDDDAKHDGHEFSQLSGAENPR